MTKLANYRVMVLLHPSLSEEGMKKEIDDLQAIIEGDEGSIKNIDHWGLRELAYPIKQVNKGYYSNLFVTTSADSLREVQGVLKNNQQVLRFIITQE